MAWEIYGRYYAPCSCDVGCPCTLGSLQADRGWCSGALVFDIHSGNVDGVDVADTKMALVGDWPAGFLAGDGVMRMYFDPGLSDEQREGLEAVVGGKKGGVFGEIANLISDTKPSTTAPINIDWGADETTVTVGDFGRLVVKPLKGPTGEQTRLLHGAAGFRDDISLANGSGSTWKDPEMRSWESGGHAEFADFDWSG